MNFNLIFFVNSILFGIGLAVDAFLISLSNGLNSPTIRRGKICIVACVFAIFQLLAPLVGWLCVRTIASRFQFFEECICWCALFILFYIGIKMIVESLCKKQKAEDKPKAGIVALIVQALITSVDALSVGFVIDDYTFIMAFVCSAIIAVITFAAYFGGFCLGKRFGTKLSGRAQLIGGVIFILIGVETLISSLT